MAERLWIPMMYFLLLGYLPLKQMRSDGNPAFGAGCGQLFIADRTVYMEVGGHSAIRGSRHDGLKLPRLFRSKGYMTDLFDAQDIARVRMYEGLSSVLVGLMKNATEGIAKMPLLLVFSTLLGIGVVLPIPAVAHAIYYGWIHQTLWLAISGVLFGVAAAVAFIPRLLIARRFGHSILDVLLHPLAVATFLMIQWYAYLSQRLGMKPPKWRGRSN